MQTTHWQQYGKLSVLIKDTSTEDKKSWGLCLQTCATAAPSINDIQQHVLSEVVDNY